MNLVKRWVDVLPGLVAATALAYLSLVPLLPYGLLGYHNAGRLLQLPLLLLATAAIALRIWGAPPRAAGLYWAIVSGISLASVCSAAQPFVGLRELMLHAGLLALAANVAAHCRSNGPTRLMTLIVIGAAVYAGLQALVYFGAMLGGGDLSTWLLAIGYENPRFMNHVQTIVLPLLVGVAICGETSLRVRRVAWVGAAMGFCMLFATFGRATMLALAVSTLIVLLFGPVGRAFSRGMLAASGMGLVLHVAVFVALPIALGRGSATPASLVAEAGSDHSRFFLWKIALDFIANSPWLGIGPMHYAHFPNFKGAHPHNVFLQIGAEYGLPVLGLLLSGVVYLLLAAKRFLPHASNTQAAMGLAALAACVAGLVDGVFSGNFVMPLSQTWFAVAAGVALGSIAGRGPRAIPHMGPVWSLVAVALRCLAAALFLGAQVWAVSQGFEEARGEVARIGGQTESREPGQPAKPRFWRDGWF